MNSLFRLDTVVNACFMGKSYSDGTTSHSNRMSHGFVYFKNGDNIYTFKGGKKVRSETGCFLYLPKYSSYSFESAYRGEVYCINLQCNDDVFGDGSPDEKSFSLMLKRPVEAESIYKRVIREMYLKKPFYELTVSSLVYELASMVFSEKNSQYTPSSIRQKLLPALDYIDEHYLDNDISIPYLAGLCDMSENYFRRLFVKYQGSSPVKYINCKKMNYASEFLRSGLYSITETASIAGFDDVGYFSRLYKKITGELPTDTKKQVTERKQS